MKIADARAAAWITWNTALKADTRLNEQDRTFLGVYEAKLAGTPTTQYEDQEVLAIHSRFFNSLSIVY